MSAGCPGTLARSSSRRNLPLSTAASPSIAPSMSPICWKEPSHAGASSASASGAGSAASSASSGGGFSASDASCHSAPSSAYTSGE